MSRRTVCAVVALMSYTKQTAPVKQGYNPNPPDLAVEVVSSDSRAENEKLTIKLGNYLAVGTVVWIVRPDKGYIEVHQSGQIVGAIRFVVLIYYPILNWMSAMCWNPQMTKLFIDLMV